MERGCKQKMKVKLKAYQYKGMLNREFPSVEEAEEIAGIMAEKHPNFQVMHAYFAEIASE